jgi:hypothetical protein
MPQRLLRNHVAVVTYRIDPVQRLVVITCSGELTATDLPETQRRLRADPDFDPTFALLFDVRLASLSQLDAATLRQAAAGTPFGTTTPRAYVTSDEAAYGLMRMLQIYSEVKKFGGPLQVFRDLDPAMAWLRAMASPESQSTPS